MRDCLPRRTNRAISPSSGNPCQAGVPGSQSKRSRCRESWVITVLVSRHASGEHVEGRAGNFRTRRHIQDSIACDLLIGVLITFYEYVLDSRRRADILGSRRHHRQLCGLPRSEAAGHLDQMGQPILMQDAGGNRRAVATGAMNGDAAVPGEFADALL